MVDSAFDILSNHGPTMSGILRIHRLFHVPAGLIRDRDERHALRDAEADLQQAVTKLQVENDELAKKSTEARQQACRERMRLQGALSASDAELQHYKNHVLQS